MKKAFLALRKYEGMAFALSFIFTTFLVQQTKAQCVPRAGIVEGIVFEDKNNNGIKENSENVLSNVLVSLYNSDNHLVAYQTADASGLYAFTGLTNSETFRVGFEYLPKYASSFLGQDNGSSVQFVTVPSCNVSLGLVSTHAECGTNPDVFTTCFVQGTAGGANTTVETIVGIEYNFNNTSTVSKYAMHGETGSVWGIAWKSTTGEIYTSAFVKQYCGLTVHGPGAIFKTKINNNGTTTTSLFANLSNLGVNVGSLQETDINNCAYGKQVGKYGLGAMVMSPGEDFIYVVNLYNKSIVKIPTVNPNASNIEEISIPNPGCSAGDYAPFALKYYNDKLYVGVTCTEETNHSAANSSAVVYEMDLSSKSFTNIFSTTYLKGYWHDEPYNEFTTQHWFTDIDFTDEGNMIIAFTDRVGHKYCNQPSNRLDHQFPDILMVWNDNGTWVLESNGHAGSLTGSGVGNGEGPNGGEFFGNDFWVTQPAYHPEIALGSVYVLPGTGSVITMAYDPGVNAYSGGMQRYNTSDGSKLGSKELYTRQTTVLFGKATGFGDIIGKCGLPKIQVGNLVWYDDNKNGIQDAGEAPVPQLGLDLLDENCTILQSTTTDAKGNYLFSDLEAGKQYYIALAPAYVSDEYQLVNINSNNYLFSPVQTDKDVINSNAVFHTGSCNHSIIPVNYDKTNHSLDIGLVGASGFDLALKNEIVNPDFSKLNELIDFRITVFNQGGVPAKNIDIVNYIPEGFTYNQADNAIWTLNGSMARTTITETILPGQSSSRIIKLRLNSTNLSKLIDVAEIASATDHNGVVQTDSDSTPDSNAANDEGGNVNTITDNKIDDNGAIDEDDQDPAMPRIVDLALRQELVENCFAGGDCFNVTLKVYNQGNITVSSFNLTNYFNPLFTFNVTDNANWVLNEGKLNYNGGSLEPGNSLTVPLKMCVKPGVLTDGIVNNAEISEMKVNGTATIRDFDSTPDQVQNNDAGGTHSTPEDNNINGIAGIEEDDHDPIYLGIKYTDLALKLTTEKRKVVEGEEACFEINVYNQGSQIIKAIKLVDYIPSNLTLSSEGWETIEEKTAEKSVVFEDGFKPGEIYTETVCFRVGSLKNIYIIENYAEVSEITDVCNVDVSSKDIDSKADHVKNNDMGGHPQTDTDNSINGLPSIDEDDHDPAILINYEALVQPCNCLANATNAINGQFSQNVTIRGPKGMTWYIDNDQVINLYSATSPAPPATPVDFATGPSGYLLTEVPYNATTSDYILTGKYEDGKFWTLVLKSTADDFVLVKGGGCSYGPVPIVGTASLCTSMTETYSAPVNISGYHVSVTGGTITSSNADSSNVEVQWGAIPGTYELKFVNKNTTSCNEPGILNVAVGNPHLAMACKSQIQVSLDNDCNVTVTPGMVVAGNLVPTAPYIVMLTDAQGNALPNNVLTHEHIGKMITAKLIEGCSGNSCWGKIQVEDKTPPVMICNDTVEVACYKMDEYPGPLTTDNCTSVIKINTLDSLVKPLYCHPDYTTFVDKTYQAVDKWGNKSSICKQTIAVKRIALDQIEFPANIEMANALTCGDYNVDQYGFPAPEETGIPTIEGYEMYPTFDGACNLSIYYTDRDFGYIGCARKIMRVWSVYENRCGIGEFVQDTQTIIIADIAPPTFACPKDLTISAGFGQCEAKATFPALTGIKDDCAKTFKVDIKYPGGFIDNTNGGSAFLPVGKHEVKYIVYDECDNRDSCTMTVTVLDKTPPTVICIRNTTVGLNSLGEGYIYASTVDDGSYDACGLDSMRIRRMDAGAPCLLNKGFAKTAPFCCKDVGKEVMVELKVWDLAGNANSCMVNVTVQDKTAPDITCPADVSITCEVDYNLNDLSKYGTATAQDACEVRLSEVATPFVDQCRVGYIQRVFTASDNNGFARCTSYIHINRLSNDLNIIWPKDYATTNGCSPSDLDPDNLPTLYAKPTFNDGVCDMAAASKDDQYFPFDDGQGSCFKIVRTWTVIDWCRKNEMGYTPAIHQQLIKVSNTVAPTIEVDSDDEACTEDGNCEEGYISLFAEGNDDCTPNASLQYKFEIDYDFDGVFVADLVDNGVGNEIDASGLYKIGHHRIAFTFEDKCGNQKTEFHDFTIKNCKAPTATCINGTSISLQQMEINGELMRMACISAESLNASSSHPCNFPITFSFSQNPDDTIKCFNCVDLGRQNISLYVIDIFGNYSVCNTYIDVQNNSASSISINATDEVLCNGETTTLTVSGMAGAIRWSTGATTPSITVTPGTTTTYTVSVTSSDGCTLTNSKVITVNPLPSPTINISGTTSAICIGQSIVLTATGGGTYLWSTGATTAAITVSPLVNITYTVTVTSAAGCTAIANRLITVNPLPVAAITNVNPICVGQSASMTASGGSTYAWNTNPVQTTATITVNPTVTTTYIVTVTSAAGCTATASRQVVVNPLPVVTINNVNPICVGQSASLTASSTGTYLWSTGATTATISVSPTTTTTYTVTVTSSAGCTATASRQVVVNPLPVVTINNVNPICIGQSATLTATGGGTYLWSNNATTASITVTPATTTTYTVTVTSAAGCTATSSRQVVVNPLPTAVITGDNNICLGESTVLTASGGTSFSWNTTPPQNTASITVAPTTTTSYTVTVTNANGCTDTEIVTVSVNQGFVAAISGDLSICIGENTTLTASGGNSYVWNTTPPQTTAAITVSPTTTTSYTVTVTNANGCTATATSQVVVNPLPLAAITAVNPICLGQSATMTASGGSTYLWSNNATTAAITVTPTTTTTYIVTVTSSAGCTSTASRQVVVNPLPTAVITGDNNICVGESTILTASGGTTFSWNTTPPQTTAAITVSPTTTKTYTVTVTNANGCTDTEIVTVTVNPLPVAAITGIWLFV